MNKYADKSRVQEARAELREIHFRRRQSWRMSCGRKVKYPSEKNANQKAKEREAATGQKLYVYPCPTCGGWHLTRYNQDERAKQAKEYIECLNTTSQT